MGTNAETTAFERGIDPVLQIMLPKHAQQVVSFQVDPAFRDRIEQLAVKSTESELTPTEYEEYVGYVRANKFVAILQRQAGRMLADSP